MAGYKIVISESRAFSEAAMQTLCAAGSVDHGDMDRAELLRRVVDADVLFVRLRHVINEEVLALAKKLKIIATPTTGLTHIDVASVKARGIAIVSLQGEEDFLKDVRATAEFTLGATLALLRNIVPACTHTQSGGWNRDLFRGRELYRKTVGIVGYGRLGRITARYFLAFGCEVLVNDVRVVTVDEGMKEVPLGEVLRRSNVVTLHANLTAENRGFFNAGCFAAMRRGAVFINTARGELIDEHALLGALQGEHLAGAALDVLSDELRAGGAKHPLVKFAASSPRLIVSPHIGGCTEESMAKTEEFVAGKVLRELRGGSV